MAQPIAKYDGNYITCYPGSNQKDDGKLNLEHNMARIVTRVTSKNFCIVKPSFELEQITNSQLGTVQLKIDVGQCSINGMDLVMTTALTIDPPENEGTYYVAFKLARDSSDNVLGDLIYGVTTTFEGVYLTYYDEKPDPMDPDMLFLGKITWTGSGFTDIEEDEDKYGKLWAEEILCKIEDPKHPDITRLNLQELIYNLPDWYFSKEGDTIYGPLIIADDRNNNNPGIIMNVDSEGSHVVIKDPTKDNDKLQIYGDVNQDGVIDQKDIDLINEFINGTKTPTELQKILGDVNHDGVIDEKDIQFIENFINKEGNPAFTGTIYFIDNIDNGVKFNSGNGQDLIEIGQGSIFANDTDDILHIHNPKNICIDSEDMVTIEADNGISLSTEKENSPVLNILDNEINITLPNTDLSFAVSYPNNTTVQQSLGGALWQYDSTTKNISLLQTNVNNLVVNPNAVFSQNIAVTDTLYLGPSSLNNNLGTYLKQTGWYMHSLNGKNSVSIAPTSINMSGDVDGGREGSNPFIRLSTNTTYVDLNSNASLVLHSTNETSGTPSISFSESNNTNNVRLSKVFGKKELSLNGNLALVGLSASSTIYGNGITTTNGVITFVNGTNNATITKDNNGNSLRTSGPLYIGATGTQPLYAGNTNISGTLSTGSSSQFKVDANGNLNTSGTITGSKVYNAVYNDIVEFMEKENYEEDIQPGDVVYFIENGKVTKWNEEVNPNAIAGIVSSEETYGYALGGEGLEDNQKVPVALKGRVYLKVNMKVKTGDILATKNGTIYKQMYNSIGLETLGIATTSDKDGKVWLMIK